MAKNILVIDGNSIMNRAFYGIRPLTNKAGLHTNAIYGTANILLKHLENLSPTHAAVAFDLKAPTFRHKMYSEYKAGRRAMPDELAMQIPYIKKQCELLGFKVLSLEGYEADDIIGTVASYSACSDDLFAYVLTGDRDSLQLINDKVNVLLAGNNDTLAYDIDAFRERYGVTPDVFVDVKALMGDSSDNIPGVAGIGEKTALKLISRFGSLDGVYENIDDKDISKGIREKLTVGHDSAYMSRTLATIDKNVPLGIGLEDISYTGYDKVGLLKLFTELEFGALIKRLELTSVQAPSTVDKPALEVSTDECNIDKLNSVLKHAELAALALELDNERACISLSLDGASEYRCVCGKSKLEELLREYSQKLIVYDSKAIFNSTDIDELTVFKFDIKLGAYVADSSVGKYELDSLTLKYLGESVENNVGAALLYRLYTPIRAALEDCGGMKVLEEIEQPLAGILSSMEKAGFKLDCNGLTSFGDALGIALDELAARIYVAAGEEFNINSPKQLGEVLFEKLALPTGKKTKTGYSTSADILEKLAPYYPIVQDILDYRQIGKLKGTYTDALVALADKDSLVHTSFNQTVTATGRLSSTEPNLQNIPIRTTLGHELRRFFIPRGEDRVFVDADYSQIELRLLAEISGDENMINAFLCGTDIHTVTASQVFGVPIDKVTPELRKRAKAVNFGIVYGIGDYSLSQDINVTKREAGEYIESYMSTYPDVAAYLKNIIAEGYDKGYVSTMFGRRRYIPELSSAKAMLKKFGERVAMNSPIQGTAADIMKLAMIGTYKALRQEGLDAVLVLQVHDELVLDVAERDARRAAEVLKEQMESVIDSKVPLTCELSLGKTWFDCK